LGGQIVFNQQHSKAAQAYLAASIIAQAGVYGILPMQAIQWAFFEFFDVDATEELEKNLGEAVTWGAASKALNVWLQPSLSVGNVIEVDQRNPLSTIAPYLGETAKQVSNLWELVTTPTMASLHKNIRGAIPNQLGGLYDEAVYTKTIDGKSYKVDKKDFTTPLYERTEDDIMTRRYGPQSYNEGKNNTIKWKNIEMVNARKEIVNNAEKEFKNRVRSRDFTTEDLESLYHKIAVKGKDPEAAQKLITWMSNYVPGRSREEQLILQGTLQSLLELQELQKGITNGISGRNNISD